MRNVRDVGINRALASSPVRILRVNLIPELTTVFAEGNAALWRGLAGTIDLTLAMLPGGFGPADREGGTGRRASFLRFKASSRGGCRA